MTVLPSSQSRVAARGDSLRRRRSMGSSSSREECHVAFNVTNVQGEMSVGNKSDFGRLLDSLATADEEHPRDRLSDPCSSSSWLP